MSREISARQIPSLTVRPILYIPPTSRQAEFAIGTRSQIRVSQTDLQATVLDVLGLGTGSNSFAPILRGKDAPSYEECHVVVQPYTGASIVVFRGNLKYSYRLSTGTVTKSELSESLEEGAPSTVADQVPYSEFKTGYMCKRYRSQ